MKKKLNERGLPSVGGVSPGDSSNNLGQARRPWHLTGASGGHSQSADSGFSSKLGRVNKGRESDEEHAYRDMFPENEEEESEDDTYNIHMRQKLFHDLRGSKPMPERKLTLDVDELIKENEEFQLFLEYSSFHGLSGGTPDSFSGWLGVGDIAGEIVGDAAAVAAGLVPGFDIGRVMWNLKQLESNIEDGKDLIILYYHPDAIKNLSGNYYNELSNVIDDIVINIGDTIQGAVSILPGVGDAAGIFATITSWASSIVNIIPKFFKKGLVGVAAKNEAIRRLSQTIAQTDLVKLDGLFDDDTSMVTSIPEAIAVASQLADMMQNFEKVFEISPAGEYNNLTWQNRLQIWVSLHQAGEIKVVSKPAAAITENEEKIRSLISEILNEESELHNCEKEHPGKTCAEWKETQPDLEEHSIGGYTGPMASPANPKEFNKTMQKVSFPD